MTYSKPNWLLPFALAITNVKWLFTMSKWPSKDKLEFQNRSKATEIRALFVETATLIQLLLLVLNLMKNVRKL